MPNDVRQSPLSCRQVACKRCWCTWRTGSFSSSGSGMYTCSRKSVSVPRGWRNSEGSILTQWLSGTESLAKVGMGSAPYDFACVANLLVSLDHILGSCLPPSARRESAISCCMHCIAHTARCLASSLSMTGLQAVMEHAAQHMPCLCMHMLLRLCANKAVVDVLHLFVGRPFDLPASLHH